MKKIKQRCFDRIDSHMAEVMRGASVAMVMRVFVTGLSFGLNVLLARLLGAEGAGLYFLALTIVTVGMTFGKLGLDSTILRFIAAHSSRGEWGIVKEVYRKGIVISALASLLVTLVLAFMASWLAESVFNKPNLTEPIRWMSISIMPMAMLFLHGEAIKALKKVRDSQLVNGLLLPLIAICSAMLLVPAFGVTGAALAHTIGATIAALVGLMIWRRNIQDISEVRKDFPTSEIFQSSMPLFCVALMIMMTNWSSFFLLGIWGSKADVGIYGAAFRTSTLISIFLVSLNSILAPKFSALYANNDMDGLAYVARQSAKIMTFLATPVLIVFIAIPEWVMGIFGSDFQGGGLLLAILAVGQFINVATGSVGYLLIMTGNENLVRNNALIVGGASLVIGLIFIPLWGSIGAALTSALSLSLLNLASFYLVWKKFGIFSVSLTYLKK